MFDIMKFFTKDNSKDVAKERLKLVLVHDRNNTSPELLEMIKTDILNVLLKYVDIDDTDIDLKITRTELDSNGKPALVANIPIKNMKRK
jgi:cell division topological specificity factor